MPSDEAWKAFLRQQSSRGGRPIQFGAYQDAVRALLEDDDYDRTPPTVQARMGGQPWWAEYGFGPVMIVVMMATLLWALVDRDTSSSHPTDQAPVCSAAYGGRCR